MLRELLRRVGGGSVIMLDADGNVWSHHLATSASGARYVCVRCVCVWGVGGSTVARKQR